MEALIGAVVGGLLTALGTFVITMLQDRRGQARSARDQRLAAAREVLEALQELNRRMIDLARVESKDHADREWPELHRGTMRWNSAMFAAALIAPQSEIDMLHQIDAESDRVMDQALAERWDSRDFRTEREHLGQLGAEYLNLVRVNEGLPKTQIESLWPWSARG